MSEHSPVTAIPEDTCWQMLSAEEFGRLAFHLADEVHLVPINYAVDERRRIVFRTAEGSKLLGLTMNADVAFEIDHFGQEEATSIVVRGRARQLEGHEEDEIEQRQLLDLVLLVALELAGPTAHHDAGRLLLAEVVDLERHVGVHRQAEQLAALRRAEDDAAAFVDGVVDRHEVHLVGEVKGEPAELLRAQHLPAGVLGDGGDGRVLGHAASCGGLPATNLLGPGPRGTSQRWFSPTGGPILPRTQPGWV